MRWIKLVMEVRIGSEELKRSVLKSSMSSKDLERDGGSFSRMYSGCDKTDGLLEGDLSKRPHTQGLSV